MEKAESFTLPLLSPQAFSASCTKFEAPPLTPNKREVPFVLAEGVTQQCVCLSLSRSLSLAQWNIHRTNTMSYFVLHLCQLPASGVHNSPLTMTGAQTHPTLLSTSIRRPMRETNDQNVILSCASAGRAHTGGNGPSGGWGTEGMGLWSLWWLTCYSIISICQPTIQ